MIPALADPSGPPDTRPPTKPGPPAPPPPAPPSGLAADLDHAELLLRCVELLARRFTGVDPALRFQLDSGLRTARRAVDGAKTPAQPLSSAAAVAGPVRLAAAAPVASGEARAGSPPAPGAGTFDLPPRSLFPMFDPVADADPTDFSDLAVAGKPIPRRAD